MLVVCVCEIYSDIMMIYNDPPPGMFIVPDKDDMTTVCILFSHLFLFACDRLMLVKYFVKFKSLCFY